MIFLTINDDFSLPKIMESGQAFRIKLLENGFYRFIKGDSVLYIRETVSGEYEASCSENEWHSTWIPYFDLERNYSEIRSQIPVSDIFLNKAAEAGRGIRILRQDAFEMLISFIISQRKNIPAIQKAVETVSEKYGHRIDTQYETVFTFPTVDELLNANPDSIEDCRLGYRAPYVLDAVQKSLESLKPDLLSKLSDEELLSTLMTIKGVGIKVSNCVALFGYGRTSLAPVDIWIQKVIDCCYGGISPFIKYGTAAGIMQQYMYFYAQTHKNEF